MAAPSTKQAAKIAESLNELSASELARRIAVGEITAEAVVRDCLARIEAREPTLQAWASLDPDHALKQARALDRGPRKGALHGVPVGVKDIIDTTVSRPRWARRSTRATAPQAMPPAWRSFGLPAQ